MTYARIEPEAKLCSPGDQTYGQDKITSSRCRAILREQNCLLPPPWMSLQMGRRENDPAVGQLPGESAPWAAGRRGLEHCCLCKRSWHRGNCCALTEVLTKCPLSQKREEEAEISEGKKCVSS